MEFKIEKKDKKNSGKYDKTDIDIAYNFSKKIYKELGKFIKAIVIFGSAARKKKDTKDIDVLLIIDDLTMVLTKELVQTYRIITEKVIADTSTKLHVTTLRFTNFWEYVRSGDPVAVNILRDGYAIIDNGFFEPLQALLYQGRIRPTPESVWAYFARAPETIKNSKWHLLQATVDLYWAVIDSAHASLMKIGEVPPSPEHVSEMMEEKLVKTGLMDKRYPKIMSRFYDIMKMISSRDIKEISGEQYTEYLKESQDFVKAMEEFIKK
ncbi:nucleotidyltransferase domain-containing protein [Bacteroidota bacterium]